MGVLLSAARVKQEAYASGIAVTGTELTEVQKVMARSNIIMQDSVAMHGDLVNTQSSAANQARRLWNELKDSATVIGLSLQPALEVVLGSLTDISGALVAGATDTADWIGAWLDGGGLEDIEKFLGAANTASTAGWYVFTTYMKQQAIPAIELASLTLGVLWAGLKDRTAWAVPGLSIFKTEVVETTDAVVEFVGPVRDAAFEARELAREEREAAAEAVKLAAAEKEVAKEAKAAAEAHAEFFATLTKGSNESVPMTSTALGIFNNTVKRLNAETGDEASARFWDAYNSGFVDRSHEMQTTVLPDLVGGPDVLVPFEERVRSLRPRLDGILRLRRWPSRMFSGMMYGRRGRRVCNRRLEGRTHVHRQTAGHAVLASRHGAGSGQAALAAFSAVWKDEAAVEEEIAARESFAGIHASAVETFRRDGRLQRARQRARSARVGPHARRDGGGLRARGGRGRCLARGSRSALRPVPASRFRTGTPSWSRASRRPTTVVDSRRGGVCRGC